MFFQRRSSRGNFIVPAPASVSSHAGHSLKAALGTITFLFHRFVQYLFFIIVPNTPFVNARFVTLMLQAYPGQAGHRVGQVMKMEVKKDRAFQQAVGCLSPERAAELLTLAGQDGIEEVRLRAGWPPSLRTGSGERQTEFAPATAQELRETLSRAARYSVHSYAESMKHGFIPLEGGHRLGLCGTVAEENGQVVGVRGLSSVNLRVARQVDGLDDMLRPWVGNGAPESVLLLAPPGFGKTTLLRIWVRLVSDAGYPVSVADERGEIAALRDGVPQFDLGRCTDVLEGCAKAQAVLMLLKTMSPVLLAMDEITAPEDLRAIAVCAHCGTAVLASAHAVNVDDLRRRPLYRALLALGVFSHAVVITRHDGSRQYQWERLEETSCSS